MKKTLFVMLVCVIMAFGVLLSACGPEHKHEYSSEWKHDSTYHWHEATCEHTGEATGKAEHTFDGNECTICHYKKESQDPPEHEHELTKVDAVSGNCSKEGTIEYYTCACGKMFKDADAKVEITNDDDLKGEKDPTKHIELTKHEAKAATCSEEGTIEYYTCVCEKKFKDAEGKEEITNDSELKTAKDPNKHVELKKQDEKSANCVQEGTIEYYTCDCGKRFKDEEGKQEITNDSELNIEIDPNKHIEPLTKHEKNEATCSEAGNEEYFECK